MKRQRGRGRKPGGGFHPNQHHHHPNRAMESNGPDIKVRGPAAHIYERYLQLARDAASSGDRVLSENYLQHADHYFRLVRQMQPAMPPPQSDRFGDGEFDGEDDGAPEGERTEIEAGGEGEDQQPEVEFAQPSGEQGQGQERGEGEFRRRRGRRNRFRPGGGEGENGEAPREAREGGEEREERGERPPRAERFERRERQPRERAEPESQEGFAVGPKPAFLRTSAD